MATPSTTTAQQPPNFYETAAKMSGSPAASGQKPSPDDPQEFLKDTTKLLAVLAKMGKSKPKGIDISKYMKASADAVEKAVEAVYGGKQDDSTGTSTDTTGDAEASASATPPPDTGATGATS